MRATILLFGVCTSPVLAAPAVKDATPAPTIEILLDGKGYKPSDPAVAKAGVEAAIKLMAASHITDYFPPDRHISPKHWDDQVTARVASGFFSE